MLKGNLSSRPFYNERAVSLVVMAAVILGIALTVFNVTAVYRLSAERSKQEAEEERTRLEEERVKLTAQKLEQGLDKANLVALTESTREANWLIDQRTFSWTEFFGYLERTMPRDARLVSVAPRAERSGFKIVMLVNIKQLGDLESLMESMDSSSAFKNTLPTDQQRLDDGTLSVTLETSYIADTLPSSKRNKAGHP